MYSETFTHKMKTEIIPVIHMVDQEQVFNNIEICIDCGIKKVFLINHDVSAANVYYTAIDAKKKNIP